jgi:predicted transcriptional regulator
MKSVLISIQPKWCQKIASREKTIEVRKTRPKLDRPFKVYIYETQGETDTPWVDEDGHFIFKGRGEVIGEFVCDRIEDFSQWEFDYPSLLRHINLYAGTDGDYRFLDDYFEGEKKGYGWHVSNLKIYDKPKELSEFRLPCTQKQCASWCKDMKVENAVCLNKGKRFIIRPPQSWFYVEDNDGNI